MLEFILQAVTLLIPLVFSGIVLIACIKARLFVGLDIPIDGGRTWRGAPLFGRNKTYRGVLVHFVAAIIACGVLWALEPYASWVSPVYNCGPVLLGSVFAAAYIVGELLNSFVKRRVGVPAGGFTTSLLQNRVQYFFDTADGIIVVGLALGFIFAVPWGQVLLAVTLAYFVHVATDGLMRKLGLKKHQKQHRTKRNG